MISKETQIQIFAMNALFVLSSPLSTTLFVHSIPYAPTLHTLICLIADHHFQFLGFCFLFSCTRLTVDRKFLHELDMLARLCRDQKARADACNVLPHDSALMAQFNKEYVR